MQQVGSRQFDDVLLWPFVIGAVSERRMGLGPGATAEEARARMQPQVGALPLQLSPLMPLTSDTLQAVRQVRHAEHLKATQGQVTPPRPGEYDSEGTPHHTGDKPFAPRPFGSMGGRV